MAPLPFMLLPPSCAFRPCGSYRRRRERPYLIPAPGEGGSDFPPNRTCELRSGNDDGPPPHAGLLGGDDGGDAGGGLLGPPFFVHQPVVAARGFLHLAPGHLQPPPQGRFVVGTATAQARFQRL